MPALTRSILYGGLRLGLYEPSKYVCKQAFGSTNLLLKIASGAFSGAIATALTNPMEVKKVRLQMKSNLKRGAIGEMNHILSEEGTRALWKGVGPAMSRAAGLTASQLATYDETKQASDVNSAIEASRKSRVAFAAASANLEGAQHKEGISSVKQALDYNFHDVEGLLRLVRLAMEATSR